MAAPTMTAAEIRRAIYAHFMPAWAVVFEVSARPEHSLSELLAGVAHSDREAVDAAREESRRRRIDALLVRRTRQRARTPGAGQLRAVLDSPPASLFTEPTPPSRAPRGDDGGLERLALEIKVSRGDFLADVRKPVKQEPWREIAHRHAYVVPAGLVQLAEVPAGSGLLEITPATDRYRPRVKWARVAPRTSVAQPLPVAIQLDAFYRWARAEALTRGVERGGHPEVDDDVERLRAELARVRHENELLTGRVEQAKEARDVWKRRYAAVDSPTCVFCGKPIRPMRKSRDKHSEYLLWEHAPADEEACKAIRFRIETERVMALPADRRYGIYPPPPEPVYPWDEPAEQHEPVPESCTKTG